MTITRKDHQPYPFVIIIDQWASKPVFHAGGEWRKYAGVGHEQYLTRCGSIHITAGGWHNGVRLQLRHAEMFARPCRRCFR